jgi:hypothetical protein
MAKHPGREVVVNGIVDVLDAITPDLEDVQPEVGTPPDPPPNEKIVGDS